MPAERLPVIKNPSPKRRGRSSKKLLLFLFVFFITLLLVLFFQSSLSKITVIEIQGQELVSPDEIGQAAAVKPGDHFFSVSTSRIEDQVKALRMVESVDASKHFPGKIVIEVKEYAKVAYQISDGGQVEALLADASIVPVKVQGVALDMPILSGWANDDPLKTKLCLAMSKVPSSYFSDISEIKPFPSDSFPDRIKMYTRSSFEVQTTIGKLPEKIKYLDSYIASLRENKITSGIIKLLEADSHIPFDAEPPAKTGASDGGAAAPPASNKDSAKTSQTSVQNNASSAANSGKDAKPPSKETSQN
ncbi:cell division protein FtsQ/DivIB [Paenibacillus allorhizosphaerae]|uniref:Cell division protein DivIB n=1 Tax=Paenibacillus allorhizosphaerae TaxID=2849866 RepID=A0ABN7TFZ1_9BACL|nr:FtsQ-type POTRA domain-containing protein [Paenibacillus allorhizosphaerae]CAG7620870.1 Cell division protein DivIB [Paenibacillus allorhizosphaerae]